MKNFILHIKLIFLFSFILSCKENNTVPLEQSKGTKDYPSIVLNDMEISNDFLEKAKQYVKEENFTKREQYLEQIQKNKTYSISLEPKSKIKESGTDIYDKFKNGVLILGSLVEHQSNLYLSYASGFLIDDQGIAVTNYHVFKSRTIGTEKIYEAIFARDFEGNIYTIKEILAANKRDDIIIFRIDPNGKKLSSIPLGDDLPPGSDVHLISHPDNNFYTYTRGTLNRSYIKHGTSDYRQAITADFAKGSSGAPIIDECGNIVGMVTGTQNIYYGQNRNSEYQMTIKEIVPVSRLKELIK